MKEILLVLSSPGTSDKAIKYAVERVRKDKTRLIALYVLETDLAQEVSENFSDIGFIGDRPSTLLSESIMKEYRQRGYEELGRVQIKAMEEGVDFEPIMEQGDFAEKVLELIRRLDVKLAILVKKEKKFLFKYLSRSPADEVKEKAACEVVIFTDE